MKVETDILCPVHVRVERRVTVLPDVQATFNALIVIFTDAAQRTNVDATNPSFHTPFNDVLCEAVNEVGATFRPRMMQSRGSFAARLVARGDFLREVITTAT